MEANVGHPPGPDLSRGQGMSSEIQQDWLLAARDYMHGLQLPGELSLEPRQFRTLESFHNSLNQVMNLELGQRSAEQWEEFFTYRVPLLGPGGACSLQGELAPDPFDLRPVLGLAGQNPEQLHSHTETRRLAILRRTCRLLARATQADWTGIYQVVESEQGPELVKMAYQGRASRARFPLNEQFAQMSNNSKAALSKRGVLVEDVAEHLAEGKPYYECDPRVKSELCLPLVHHGRTLGLIDVESFKAHHFTLERRLMAVLAGLHLVSSGTIPEPAESGLVH